MAGCTSGTGTPTKAAAEVASQPAQEMVEGVQRTGDVLTGANLRKFDDFTEAVTRVCVGLHRDNVDLRSQLARLEQQLEESNQAQKGLAARLEALEGSKCECTESLTQ